MVWKGIVWFIWGCFLIWGALFYLASSTYYMSFPFLGFACWFLTIAAGIYLRISGIRDIIKGTKEER